MRESITALQHTQIYIFTSDIRNYSVGYLFYKVFRVDITQVT